jgi:protease-4
MRRLALLLLAAAIAIAIGAAILRSGPDVPDSSVLVIRLTGELEEAPAVDSLQQLLARGPALPTLLLQLAKAAADPRIEAILLHVHPLQVGYARLQELRDGITRFRESGKPVIALLDLETFNATREFYLASAASKVYVVPRFLGPLAGVAGQVLSLGGFFETIGVEWQYERIGKYKSAPELFAERQMSPAAREQTEEFFDGIFGQIVSGLADSRGLDEERVRELVEQAPGTAEEVVQHGLADGIVARDGVLELAGLQDAEEVEFDVYIHVDPGDVGLRGGPTIALVFGDGTVITGGNSARRGTFGARATIEALRSAAEDDEVRAIVLRVNSPGGSTLASEQIWHAIRSIRREKPVVVSMGDYAASGGYYIASAADAIVAEPATITGSIGVFVVRPAFTGLYEKLEIGSELIARGPHAGIMAGDEPLTAGQLERIRHFIGRAYHGFLERVATGREITTEEVDRLGQGQIWLGDAALAHDLIDALGGLDAAVERAKQAADIPDEVDPKRVVFPGPRSLARQIRDLTRGELRGWLVSELLPLRLSPIAEATQLAFEGGIAYLPSHWIEIH